MTSHNLKNIYAQVPDALRAYVVRAILWAIQREFKDFPVLQRRSSRGGPPKSDA